MTAGLPPADDPDIEYVGHSSWRLEVPGVALEIAEVQLELLKGVSPEWHCFSADFGMKGWPETRQ